MKINEDEVMERAGEIIKAKKKAKIVFINIIIDYVRVGIDRAF
jgi:hypothetical protein